MSQRTRRTIAECWSNVRACKERGKLATHEDGTSCEEDDDEAGGPSVTLDDAGGDTGGGGGDGDGDGDGEEDGAAVLDGGAVL